MPADSNALAEIYAKSLFELAEADGGNDSIQERGDELEQVCELARGDAAFRKFLASPIIDARRRGDSLRKILSGQVSDLLLRFLLVVNDKGRLSELEAISTAFNGLVEAVFGRVEIDVYTPTPIDEATRLHLKTRIGEVIGKEPVLHCQVDATMIGGLRLRIGDQLIDGSIQTQLRRLGHRLVSHGSDSIRGDMATFVDGGDGR
jgi:F-type H+-transporting ATPase subunit delta